MSDEPWRRNLSVWERVALRAAERDEGAHSRLHYAYGLLPLGVPGPVAPYDGPAAPPGDRRVVELGRQYGDLAPGTHLPVGGGEFEYLRAHGAVRRVVGHTSSASGGSGP